MHSEYNFLFLHLCLGVNFSSHQKHNPFYLLSSNSLLIKGFVGLIVFCVVYLEAGGGSSLGWDDFEVLEMDGKGPLKAFVVSLFWFGYSMLWCLRSVFCMVWVAMFI